MSKMPTWECGMSEFDWCCDMQEACILLEGEVTVVYINLMEAGFIA